MSKARWWNILDTLQDEVETPWRKSLCKVVSKGEGSLEDLEPDGSTKSNLWSDAPFMSFTTSSRIVRGGVMLLQSRAVSHDRTVPTDRWICCLGPDLQHNVQYYAADARRSAWESKKFVNSLYEENAFLWWWWWSFIYGKNFEYLQLFLFSVNFFCTMYSKQKLQPLLHYLPLVTIYYYTYL